MAKYWFKRRRYGWGWIPVTWQGWLTVFTFLVVVLASATTLEGTPDDQWSSELGVFLLILLLAIGGLFMVSSLRGPAPKWRWGKSEDDNPDEDF